MVRGRAAERRGHGPHQRIACGLHPHPPGAAPTTLLRAPARAPLAQRSSGEREGERMRGNERRCVAGAPVCCLRLRRGARESPRESTTMRDGLAPPGGHGADRSAGVSRGGRIKREGRGHTRRRRRRRRRAGGEPRASARRVQRSGGRAPPRRGRTPPGAPGGHGADSVIFRSGGVSGRRRVRGAGGPQKRALSVLWEEARVEATDTRRRALKEFVVSIHNTGRRTGGGVSGGEEGFGRGGCFFGAGERREAGGAGGAGRWAGGRGPHARWQAAAAAAE